MSNIKKLLALVLALTMVLSVSAFAGYTIAPYGDAEKVNEDCEVAVQLLYSLDIMKGDDKGNFNPEATITRAEMAKMIYVILNKGEDDLAVNYKGAKIFSDVAVGSWYEGYVNYMAMTKLVQGRPDGTFGPNAPITTAEAAKMLLTAIGYSAENRGYVGAGWDKQVLSDAAIIGLLKDYNYNTTGYAPRQWVAVMVKNALTDALTYSTIAPVIFNGLLTGTNAGYEYVTMGQKYFGLYKWSGVIVANEYADLNDSETLSSGRTQIAYYNDADKLVNITFKNWSTDLNDIGESRWGYACDSNVMYVGDTGDNVTFSTGEGTTIAKKYVDGIKLDYAEFFLNFEETKAVKDGSETANGEWLKVIDNDDDGYAEYVFVTEFEMTEVTKVAKNGTVTLANGVESKYFVMSEDVAAGDVVLYTKIDDNKYVEIAETFEGDVDKFTYKTYVLTVEGEDYGQSGIDISDEFESEYYTDIQGAERKTTYVFYRDLFGYVRAYAEPVGADGEVVLLTDAYYEVNRDGKVYAVQAYLDGEVDDYDVKKPGSSNDVSKFIKTGSSLNNAWGMLNTFAPDSNASTNLARYTVDDEGVLTLYDATTYYYDKKGDEAGIKTAYIDLTNSQTVEAGQTSYVGTYAAYEGDEDFITDPEQEVKVQANKDTVFYYVSQKDGAVKAVTGYKNSYDIVAAEVEVKAMYAVASNIESDASEDPYWVADVIVIETKYPVFNLSNDIVLGYDIVNKTVKDFANMDVIGADAALDNLDVTSIDGYNSFNKSYFEIPGFYFNTENEDGESHIRQITSNFDAYDIFAIEADRVFDLKGEYFVSTEGNDFFYDENTIVYDIDDEGNYNSITSEDSYEDALELTTGEKYILYTDGDGYIIYAIWVENYKDVCVNLYNAIAAESEVAFDKLADAKADAVEAYSDLIDETAETYGDWTEADIANAKAAVEAAIEEMTDIDDVEDLTDNAAITTKFWADVVRPQVKH